MAVAGCTGLGGWSTGGEGGLTAGWMVVGLGTPVSVSGCSLSGVGLQELGSSGCPSPITGLGGGGDLVIATLRYDDGKLGRRRETIPEVIFQM